MAIWADRHARNATSENLPVDTLHELVSFSAMTLAARVWNVDFRNCRLRICGRQNLVGGVTISANSRTCVAARHGFRMDTLAIGKKDLVADPTSFHYGLISVAAPARRRDVRAIHRGSRIARRQHRGHVVIARMTIHASRRLSSILQCLSMEAVAVAAVLGRVKKRTREIWKLPACAMTGLTLKCR